MKTGTTFNITLIADERMLGNCADQKEKQIRQNITLSGFVSVA